ncbi:MULTISPECIES: hypothetical protein [Acidithiobacillus]|uniref:hypothetical protein n=1 Tax=Acidithiobacillus TaxID=119977 RepID=UPI0004E0BB48|nr:MULTISPECIES: hypothetical protein [Acidithiobacillus]MDD2750718.1 hypothetical protein [Acidithiobacillus sp.]MDD5278620.1 hypothetical protein [Acidithiobacillus sp.]
MDESNKPPFAWVMDGPGTFDGLARNPSLLPARHTKVINNDEERIEIETSLFLHQHHRLAFSEFPDFASWEADPLEGLSRKELLEMTSNTCPQLPAIDKSSWPWKRTDSSVTFNAGITMGFQEDKSEKNIFIITMSAKYPMNHLAWLWALQKGAIRLLPIMTIRHPMLVMIIDPDKADSTQLEVIYDDPGNQISSRLRRAQQLKEHRLMLLAVPRTMKTWLASDDGEPCSQDWSNHALFLLEPVGQRCALRPFKQDSVLLNKLSTKTFVSSKMGSSAMSD